VNVLRGIVSGNQISHGFKITMLVRAACLLQILKCSVPAKPSCSSTQVAQRTDADEDKDMVHLGLLQIRARSGIGSARSQRNSGMRVDDAGTALLVGRGLPVDPYLSITQGSTTAQERCVILSPGMSGVERLARNKATY
jgi:hypothetical protein